MMPQAGRQGGHGGTPTSRCQATRAMRLALEQRGDTDTPLADLLEIARTHRPTLSMDQAERVLHRLARDGEITYEAGIARPRRGHTAEKRDLARAHRHDENRTEGSA